MSLLRFPSLILALLGSIIVAASGVKRDAAAQTIVTRPQGAGALNSVFQSGSYAGACVMLAAEPPEGAPAFCLDQGSVTTLPFYVTWEEEDHGFKLQFAADQVVITGTTGKQWGYAAYTSAFSYVNVTRMHGSRAHCITFVDEEMGVLKFKGYTEQVGTTGGWVYVQEGEFDTQNNVPAGDMCPSADNPKLYCNAHKYNYRCVAYLM